MKINILKLYFLKKIMKILPLCIPLLINWTISVTAQNHRVMCDNSNSLCNKGLLEEGTITNGKKEGYWKFFYCCLIKQDVSEEGRYENDLRIGLWKFHSVDGYVYQIVPYVNGLRNGDFTGYHQFGEIQYKGTYKNDELVGERTEFYKNGKIKGIENFNTGETTFYYENGKIKETGFYTLKEWEKTNEWKEYYENGKLKSVGSFANSERNGLWKEYYSNGKINTSGEMLTSRRFGKWEIYFDNGQLNGTGMYKEGGEPLADSWVTYDRNGQKNGINIPEPNDYEIRLLCSGAANRLKPKDINNYVIHFEERLAIMSGVNVDKDSREVIIKKIQTFWNAYKTNCKCDALSFKVPNGNFLKFLVSVNMISELELLTDEYKLDLNFIDPADGLTLCEYLNEVVIESKSQANSSYAKIYEDHINFLDAIKCPCKIGQFSPSSNWRIGGTVKLDNQFENQGGFMNPKMVQIQWGGHEATILAWDDNFMNFKLRITKFDANASKPNGVAIKEGMELWLPVKSWSAKSNNLK